jgi:tetratricopeptide (TPR) repeat protein
LNFLFGRMKEAIEDHQRAKEVDPFNPLHVGWLAELYRMDGRLDEAEAEAMKSIEMNPRFTTGHFVLGLVYKDRGLLDEAIEAIQKAVDVSPAWRWALGSVFVKAGRVDEARDLLNELNSMKTGPWTAFWKVQLNAALGNNDEALRWTTYEPHHHWLAWARVLDWFEPLREDPRFPDLLRRMNLPPIQEDPNGCVAAFNKPSGRRFLGVPTIRCLLSENRTWPTLRNGSSSYCRRRG